MQKIDNLTLQFSTRNIGEIRKNTDNKHNNLIFVWCGKNYLAPFNMAVDTKNRNIFF